MKQQWKQQSARQDEARAVAVQRAPIKKAATQVTAVRRAGKYETTEAAMLPRSISGGNGRSKLLLI